MQRCLRVRPSVKTTPKKTPGNKLKKGPPLDLTHFWAILGTRKTTNRATPSFLFFFQLRFHCDYFGSFYIFYLFSTFFRKFYTKMSTDETENENETDMNVVVNGTEYCLVGNVPSVTNVTGYGFQLCTRVAMMVTRMYMNRVSQTLMMFLSRASCSEVLNGVAQCAVLSSTVQAQATEKLLIRIPYVGPTCAKHLFGGVGSCEIDAISSKSLASTVGSIGVRGQILVIMSQILAQEVSDFAWMIAKGNGSVVGFVKLSACHATRAVGTFSGGAAGTAVGTMLMPGVGTGLGSFAGSFAGGAMADAVLDSLSTPETDISTGYVELLVSNKVEGETTTLTIECQGLPEAEAESIIKAQETLRTQKEGKEEEEEEEEEEDDDLGFLLVDKEDTSTEGDHDDGDDLKEVDDIEERMVVQ